MLAHAMFSNGNVYTWQYFIQTGQCSYMAIVPPSQPPPFSRTKTKPRTLVSQPNQRKDIHTYKLQAVLCHAMACSRRQSTYIRKQLKIKNEGRYICSIFSRYFLRFFITQRSSSSSINSTQHSSAPCEKSRAVRGYEQSKAPSRHGLEPKKPGTKNPIK